MSPGAYLWFMTQQEDQDNCTISFFLLAIPYFFGIHTAYKQQLTIRIFGAEGKRSI